MKKNLEKVIQAEAAERRRILRQAYMLILSWGEEQKKGSITVKTETVQETGPVSTSAVFIPRGKYFTIAQVAEIGNVKERTVSTWLKKGLLKGLDLPKLGQIVKEKDLEKYLKEKLYKP